MMQQLISFVTNHWELFLALAVICALLVHQTIGSIGGAKKISPQEATRMINHEQAMVLDVREPAELKDGVILGSTEIPVGDLEKQLGKLEKYKTKPVIVVCQSGSRSNKACGILRKHGFESIYNLQGGIMAWTSANLPLSRKKS